MTVMLVRGGDAAPAADVVVGDPTSTTTAARRSSIVSTNGIQLPTPPRSTATKVVEVLREKQHSPSHRGLLKRKHTLPNI